VYLPAALSSRSSRGVVGFIAALAAAGVGLGARPALAQSADTATAEELFEQGKQLLRAGNAAAACPKLAESLRIEPSTGTLLALAMCHEADGKLASAWAGFVSVEARARNEARPDREQAAHARAQALRPRLSTLEIRVPAQVASLEGVEVRRDGTVLGHGAWNVVVPMDGGEHLVEVSAPGKLTWRGKVQVKPEAEAAVLTVPPLASAPAGATSPSADGKPAGHFGTLEWTGIGLAGAGVVGLGVGGYFLSSALGKKSDSSNDCEGNVCGAEGSAARRSAVSNGKAATVFGIAGGVLAVGGATLFVVGRVRARPGESAPPSAGQLAFSVGPAGAGAQYSAHF
jgi:hypothetical protein